MLELFEVGEAHEHVQKLLIDLLSAGFQQLQEPLHIEVSDSASQLLHHSSWYLCKVGFNLRLVLLEDGLVLRLVILGILKQLNVLLDKAALHLLERFCDDDVLQRPNDTVEVGIIGVALYVSGERYCSR